MNFEVGKSVERTIPNSKLQIHNSNGAGICFLGAAEVARLIRAREVSAEETMTACLEQTGRTNPRVNAIVTLVPERAMRDARRRRAPRGGARAWGGCRPAPWPAGGPQGPGTDQGIRTTFGSLIYEDFVPNEDALIVERLRRAGAVTVGKTSTPEFGAGSQTYNEVFGETLNPYDTTRTCGGSSGGAAVALACGMVPIADGSDMGPTGR